MTSQPRPITLWHQHHNAMGIRLRRSLLYITGCVSLLLGFIGVFLPLLPTTPFLLLASACFLRSSPKAAEWMLNNRYFGEYVRDFRRIVAFPWGFKFVLLELCGPPWRFSLYLLPFLGRVGLF